jgi:hypothetical protein
MKKGLERTRAAFREDVYEARLAMFGVPRWYRHMLFTLVMLACVIFFVVGALLGRFYG